MRRIDLRGTLDEDQAERIVTEMRGAAGRPIEIRIDSPGGKLGAAILVGLEIEEHDRLVLTTVTGQASSAAGLIAMLGDRRRIVRHGLVLCHHPAPYSSRASDDVAAAIAEATGQPLSVAWRWMNAEKTFDATEAKASGLVDEIAGADLLPTVFLREPKKRPPTAWLRPWREFFDRADLR